MSDTGFYSYVSVCHLMAASYKLGERCWKDPVHFIKQRRVHPPILDPRFHLLKLSMNVDIIKWFQPGHHVQMLFDRNLKKQNVQQHFNNKGVMMIYLTLAGTISRHEMGAGVFTMDPFVTSFGREVWEAFVRWRIRNCQKKVVQYVTEALFGRKLHS